MLRDKSGHLIHMTEDESLEVITFTNIDKELFEGIWGGKSTEIKPGNTIALPRFKALHFAKQLVTKILIRQGKKYSSDLLRKPLEEKIIGSLEGDLKNEQSEKTDDPDLGKTSDSGKEDEEEFEGLNDENSDESNKKPEAGKIKPLEEWTKADLELLAEEREIDISSAKNKKEIALLIKNELEKRAKEEAEKQE